MDLKLHLGCGDKYIPGFIHIDISDAPHIDLKCDISRLDNFEENSVDLIYASHVLEHFGRHEYTNVLTEWYRILKPDGELRIAVPDFEACAKLYLSESKIALGDIIGLICGGQRDEYDYHKMIFDYKSLEAVLKKVGFLKVFPWDWADTEHAHIDDYSQAYLPHMNKDEGQLVSLNVRAIK